MFKKFMVLLVGLIVFSIAATTNRYIITRGDLANCSSVAIDKYSSSIPWSGSAGGISYSAAELRAAGEKQAGITTYDHQQNGNQGNRVIPYPAGDDTCVHVCWTYSPDEVEEHPHRAIHCNWWSNTVDSFFLSNGVKASGAFKAGYTTMGVLPDGRSVVAFHERESASLTADYVSMVAVEAGPGFRIFLEPQDIGVNNPPVVENPIWPHILVGAEGTIHVTAHVSKEEGDPDPADYNDLYYSRSTDEGVTFSPWQVIAENPEGTPGGMNDAAMAVSRDGKKIAVSWVRAVSEETSYGHPTYVESIDGGLTWSNPVFITEERYGWDFPMADDTTQLFADPRDMDLAYDDDGNLHAVWVEGPRQHQTDGDYVSFIKFTGRVMHWSEATGDFSRPSGLFGTYIWTDSTGTVLDTAMMDDAWWGTDPDLWVPGDPERRENYCGVWRPQISTSDDMLVVTFGANRFPWDVSNAGTINGEIYVAVSTDGGYTWGPTEDFSYEQKIADMDRHWWNAHKGCVTNITKTPTPDARQGSCADEDHHSACPLIGSDDILHLTYIKDLFSGPALSNYYTEGFYTDNPIIYLPYKLNVGEVVGTFNINGTHYPNIGIAEEHAVNQTSIQVLGSNVFSKSVSFELDVPLTTGSLKIYDASGSLVKTVYEGGFSGSKTLTWDGTDSKGKHASAGVYFYSFITPEINQSGRLVLVR
ncbi:hypothetical protein JXM67_07110 [candidate division WOR-3 bacterium]|nr:hypothetical protein [candidate division WOR-3 bacterium]